MSLLAFQPVENPQSLRLLDRPRWRYALALVLGFASIVLGTLVSEQTNYFALKSTLAEVFNFAIPVGIFCWIAWYREQHALRRAIVITLIWILTSCAVNILTKQTATVHFLTDGSATSWRLLGGTLFVVPPLMILLYSRNSNAMAIHGIHWTNIRWQLGLGLLVGAVIALHFLSTVRFSGVATLSLKPMPYVIWTIGYECTQSFAEEAFYRGLVYRSLQNVYKLNAWQATGVTLIANIMPYLLKADWRTPLELIGVIIYLLMIAAAGCILFRRYQSIMPGVIVNIVFSLASLLR